MRSKNYITRSAAAAMVLAGAVACNPYPSASKTAPVPVTVYLVDPALHIPAQVHAISSSTTAITTGDPSLSLVRIRLNKTIDGTTVQSSTNQVPDGSVGNFRPTFCVPAAGITMTDDGTATTFSACYDSTGPDIVITPAAAACGPNGRQGTSYVDATSGGGRIENYQSFLAGHVYEMAVSGVRDNDGREIPAFTVRVTVPSTLNFDAEEGFRVSTTYDPDTFAAKDFSANIAPGGATGPVVAPGPVDDTGLAVPVNQGAFTGFTAYGPDIFVKTDKQLCRVTGTGSGSFGPDFCLVPGLFDLNPENVGEPNENVPEYVEGDVGGLIRVPDSTTAKSVELRVAGTLVAAAGPGALDGYDASSDYVLGGDVRAFHLFPILPLEDDQEYTVTLPSTLSAWTADENLQAARPLLGSDQVFTFRSAPGTARIQFVWPKDGADNFPPTTDLVHHANMAGLGPFVGHGIEFVASRPLKVDSNGRPLGTIAVAHKGPTDAAFITDDTADAALAADVLAIDTRHRAFAIGATIGANRIILRGGTTYRVTITDLQSDETTPATLSKTWSFTTLPYALLPLDTSAGLGSLFENQGTVTSYNAAAYGAPPLLEAWIYGEVDYDATATPVNTPTGTTTVWNIANPKIYRLNGVGVSVKLNKRVGATTGAEVTGTFGFLNNSDNSEPPWADPDNGQAPASTIAFLPDAVLDYNTQYVLTITGLKFKDGSTMPTKEIPFTTRPFVHRRTRTAEAVGLGNWGQLLVNGQQNVPLKPTLRVEFRGHPVDLGYPVSFEDTAASEAPIVLTYLGKANRPDYVKGYVPFNLDRTGATRLDLTPLTDMEPNDRYRLVITNKMKSFPTAGQPQGMAAPVVQFEFTTADAAVCLPP